VKPVIGGAIAYLEGVVVILARRCQVHPGTIVSIVVGQAVPMDDRWLLQPVHHAQLDRVTGSSQQRRIEQPFSTHFGDVGPERRWDPGQNLEFQLAHRELFHVFCRYERIQTVRAGKAQPIGELACEIGGGERRLAAPQKTAQACGAGARKRGQKFSACRKAHA